MSRTIVTGSELMKFHARHLARVKWEFFGTLAFRRSSISLSMASRSFETWISSLEAFDYEEDHFEDFLWFRVNEASAFPHKPLFHVLLAGSSAGESGLTELWEKQGGDTKATTFIKGGDPWVFVFDIARHGDRFEIKHDLLRV